MSRCSSQFQRQDSLQPEQMLWSISEGCKLEKPGRARAGIQLDGLGGQFGEHFQFKASASSAGIKYETIFFIS